MDFKAPHFAPLGWNLQQLVTIWVGSVEFSSVLASGPESSACCQAERYSTALPAYLMLNGGVLTIIGEKVSLEQDLTASLNKAHVTAVLWPAHVVNQAAAGPTREYLQYQCQCWETEQLIAASNQPNFAPVSSPRVLDQELVNAPVPPLSFPGVPLLCQLAPPSQLMSAATGELPLFNSILYYNYSKFGFAYLIMLGLAEQVLPHIELRHPWATSANYVMRMAPVIYWALQARPFSFDQMLP
ncbi:hypothetical protein DSO57_1030899 [Entomophthora muscae]|uniref:Uncharacterized protein n=1 Tax=Entomophthora muscae TaxID=34485 RepID=A0ACC2ULD7_9FUNG|nr:hypothetical protein DSO57_1030899 [Entomophthora muscae]